MIEINTKDGKVYISEGNILGLLRSDYYPEEKRGYYSIDVQYRNIGMVTLKFNNVSDVDSNMIFLVSKIKETKKIHNIDNQEDGYIKGFKEGCEYALKMKG